MIKVEKIEYQKAYVELYEIIKVLSKEEREKIPKIFLKNLKDNMYKEYNFKLDTEKDILSQQYKAETKALFVELYERYLMPEKEKTFWDRYDKICQNMIEEEKQKKYDTNSLFRNHIEKTIIEEAIEDEVAIVVYRESILKIFINKIKRIFNKHNRTNN